MPTEADAIRFEPVAPSHYPMLHGWLDQPHVREWWGDPDEELGLIRTIVEDDDGTEGFIVVVRDEPVGYVQSWRPSHFEGTHWQEEGPWLADVPKDNYGVDIFIGPEDRIERGMGPRIIRAFARKLFERGAPRLIIDPDADNKRAIRAYEKAGFRPFDRHDGKTESTLLMELTREEFLRQS